MRPSTDSFGTALPPVRVLIVEPDGRAGNWHYATALASALRGIGLDVVLATLSPFESLPILSGLHVIRVGRRALFRQWPVAWLPVRLALHLDKIVRLRRAIRHFRPDVVHIHGAIGVLDGAYFRYLQARGLAVCYTVHWLESLNGKASKADIARHRAADALFVHSADGASRLRAEGVDERKIWKINHLNLQHLYGPPMAPDQARRRLGLPLDSRVLLFFGVIEPRKGLDILIEAFTALAGAHPRLRLVVAGAAPDGFDGYAAQIDALGIRDRVLAHIGYVPFEEISTYFSAADIVVLPYRRIVQSGVLQLAYGFGRPVVVSDIGGIAATVQEDGTGVVAGSLQAKDLATSIDSLLRATDRAGSMAARGRVLSETKYSWPAVATEIAGAYRTILRQRTAI